MSKREDEVQAEIQIAAFPLGATLMRNNSGSLRDETGRPVRYGLGNVSKERTAIFKSSDLIGITRVVITPEMVGLTVGIFTAVEVKREIWNSNKKLDQREIAQKAFIDWVKSCGGFAGFSNSLDSFKKIIRM